MKTKAPLPLRLLHHAAVCFAIIGFVGLWFPTNHYVANLIITGVGMVVAFVMHGINARIAQRRIHKPNPASVVTKGED